jgi:hypothetical protein
MPGWFGKMKPKKETSPGGSVICRYPIEQWQPSRAGFAGNSTAAFAEKRNEVYGRLFGKVHDASKLFL